MIRYPLVAYLDEALTAKVRRIQDDLYKKTGFTVGSEVLLADSEFEPYIKDLHRVVKGMKPFVVHIRGHGFIDNWSGGSLPGNTPYGVYLKVVVTPELQRLAEVLRDVTAKRKHYFEMPWPYRPNVAVAYKDLTGRGYELAKRLYAAEVFADSTTVKAFSLVRHNADAGL